MLFGIGAATLGFLNEVLRESRVLVLGYTQDFAELWE